MANIKSRQSLNEKDILFLADGSRIATPRFTGIKKFQSVGFSLMYTAKSNVDGRNGIKKGDLVYFKANNKRGVNGMGRTDESRGSCEDVAEVLAYYTLTDMAEKLGEGFILRATPYDFAEYSHDEFWKIIASQTSGFVESSRLYGCVSKNIIGEHSEIMHGHLILGLCLPKQDVMKTTRNTIFNYQKGLEEFCRISAKSGVEAFIHPICARYDANIMFWDYFFSNSDRHCKNIIRQKTLLSDGSIIIEPLPLLDNGGGLILQYPNCAKVYFHEFQKLQERGRIEDGDNHLDNPFHITYDFNVGKEMFIDSEIAEQFDSLSYIEQMVVFISQNKTLYQDFKNMYQNIDLSSAYAKMISETRFNPYFIEGFIEVAEASVKYKKECISKVMAKFLGEEFNQELFDADLNYYLNRFEQIVKEDEITVHIATNDEIMLYEEGISKLKAYKQPQK